MATQTITPELTPARLMRLSVGQEARLGADMDPLRRLMRRRDDGISVTLRRKHLFESLCRGRDCGPASNFAV